MALHYQLPIYRDAYALLDVAVDVMRNVPRDFKRLLGEKVRDECIEIVVLIFRANVHRDKLHESPQWLNAAHDRIAAFLPERLNLQINPKKTILQPIDRGVDFVGQVIKPWRRTTRRRTVNHAIARIGRVEPAKLLETTNSYFGRLRQASRSRRDRVRLANAILRRGRSVDGCMTKTFRKH